jgi:opacity protein-like surface antigen
MKKITILTILMVVAAASLCCAEIQWSAGVEGAGAIARMNFENNMQIDLGYSGTFLNSETNESRTKINLLILNKITTNTYWKIGGGLMLLSGKSLGATYTGTGLSFIVGAEYRMSERISIDLQVAPITMVSTSFDGNNSSGTEMLRATIGALITL